MSKTSQQSRLKTPTPCGGETHGMASPPSQAPTQQETKPTPHTTPITQADTDKNGTHNPRKPLQQATPANRRPLQNRPPPDGVATEPQTCRREARHPLAAAFQHLTPGRRVPTAAITRIRTPQKGHRSCCDPNARGRVAHTRIRGGEVQVAPRMCGAGLRNVRELATVTKLCPAHPGRNTWGQHQGHDLRSATFQPCTRNRHIAVRANDSKGSPPAARASGGTLHLHLSAR